MADVSLLPADIIPPPPPPVEAADPWPAMLLAAVLVLAVAALWALRRRRRWAARWRLGRLQQAFLRGRIGQREAAFRLAALMGRHLRLQRLGERPPLTRKAVDPAGWQGFVQALDRLRYAPPGEGAAVDLMDLFDFARDLVAKAP